MKKKLIVLLCLTFLFSCKSRVKEDIKKQKEKYPQVVDSLGIQKIYDEAKWWTYCINCDNQCKFFENGRYIDTTITFGETTIKSKAIRWQNVDTIDFIFEFYFDTLKCFDNSRYKTFPSLGIQYKLSNKTPIAIITVGSLEYSSIVGVSFQKDSRYFVPLQPDVIKYINDNKAKINPWFYKEAQRRGVIKD